MIAYQPSHVVVVALILFMLARVAYYQLKLRSIKQYRSKYQSYLDALSTNAQDWSSFDTFAESRTEILKLFDQAKLTEGLVPVFKDFPIGNNLKVQSGTAEPWDNLTATDKHIVAANRKTFHEAIGYFRARRNETFSITYWIELVVLHPRMIVGSLGGNKDGIIAILLNIVAIPSEAIAIYEWFIRH